MKKIIKNFLNILIEAVPDRGKYILFESVPDLSDNTKAVFDEMVNRGFNNKYKLIWLVSDAKKNFPKISNVIYLDKKNKFSQLCIKWFQKKAKCFICCNDFFGSSHPDQISYYLSHGTPIKSLHNYYVIPNEIDYCIAAGKAVVPMDAYEFSFPEERTIPLGFPRNDALTNAKRDIKKLFCDIDCDKILVWYPTYRQHKNGTTTTAKALPIINDIEKAKSLNECAKKNKTLIVLKPHFAQDVSYIKDLKLSNILFINDAFFEKHEITSYEFVGNCDALITDYSSIYFDYMLCDKPIALIWEDYEEYKHTPGFAQGVEEFLSGGEKIYTLDELEEFVECVANDRDRLKEERNKVCERVNYSRDAKNAKRVVDFIEEKSKL